MTSLLTACSTLPVESYQSDIWRLELRLCRRNTWLQSGQFLSRGAMLPRYICCRRVSVCPSITRRYCTKNENNAVNSPGTLVF